MDKLSYLLLVYNAGQTDNSLSQGRDSVGVSKPDLSLHIIGHVGDKVGLVQGEVTHASGIDYPRFWGAISHGQGNICWGDFLNN